MTWDELVADMGPHVRFPGMANIWWMPVQTRTEMLATGMRSNLGIKVFGPELATIEEIAVEIEEALRNVAGTRSVFAERVTGGYYVDFEIRREAAARYGLTVGDVEDVIETAIGGKNIAQTVEGRERYPINVRYLREFRDDVEKLREVLIATPTGAQIPMSLVADIRYSKGAPQIRDENGQVVGYVFVDVEHKDYEGYIRQAQQIVRENVTLPAGYRIEWAGQYKYLLRTREHLKVILPLTLFIVIVLLYLNTGSGVKTAIVLLAVPFSAIGAIWLLYWLGYNMSVAVWVGLIALLGVAAETGVFMLLYLDLAFDDRKKKGLMKSMGDLKEAIIEGAVKRVRPKCDDGCNDVHCARADYVVGGNGVGCYAADRRADGRRNPDVVPDGVGGVPADLPDLAGGSRFGALNGRLLMCRVVALLLVTVAAVPLARGEFRYEVRRDKFWGSEAGVLTIDASGVHYRSENEKTLLDFVFEDIRKADVSDPRQVRLFRYERAKKRFARPRLYQFKILGGNHKRGLSRSSSRNDCLGLSSARTESKRTRRGSRFFTAMFWEDAMGVFGLTRRRSGSTARTASTQGLGRTRTSKQSARWPRSISD